MPKNAVFPKVFHQPLAFSYVETVMDMQKLSFEELMVLGKPGAGKTTFLKHLVLQATNGKINKIPIFVSLKAWSDSDHLLNRAGLLAFIAEQFDICDFPSSEKFVEIIVKEGHAS